MKSISLIILIIFFFSGTYITAQTNTTELNISKESIDSLAYVANQFLWFNKKDDPNFWLLDEKGLGETSDSHPNWVKKYYPKILAIYKMPYWEQLTIAGYLYMEGDQIHFLQLVKDSQGDKERIRVANMCIKEFHVVLPANLVKNQNTLFPLIQKIE